MTALADALGAGQFTLDVIFNDLTSGFVQTHTARLVVEGDLSVTPTTDMTAAGREGGPVHSSPTVYTLRNVGGGGVMTWTASSDPPVAWIIIDGQSSVGGSLDIGDSANVTVDIDTVAAAALSAGTHEADVLFDSGTGQQVRRHVRLDLSRSVVTTDERSVPTTATQPGGPTYLYRMSRMPTTNAEFAAFLNDARANLDNDRGRYMFFDLDSGDVYVSDTMAGRDGTEAPNATLTTRMYDAGVGRIVLLNDAFQIETGFEAHPVVGVSWYGAVKYANWLTLDQGFAAGDRCYTESDGADSDGWHPVSVSSANWAVRPMNDAERTTLVDECRGYRLPMDHHADQASFFNEWYKAAAWDPAANGGLGINRVYGFGRDTITSADANFQCSGDIFEDGSDCMIGGTTPAGHFDGTNVLADGTPTNTNANGFGFVDMTGNVFQWMQGRLSASRLGHRTIRGGGWDSPEDSLLLKASGRIHAPADQTDELIGFRVLRTLLPADGDANQDGTVDQTDFGV
ncbi:MAG: SUMF1/EgtB/PvdO family nonheme iron enzyme, partial [Acidobacteria bacterium]|nr:SUMF1/EgtB/PvdO family nonheme iron enzyme [Acidobacteriota bacterium]